MAGHVDGEDRRVSNADVGGSVDDELGVDDTALVLGTHRARAMRVVLRASIVLDPGLPLLISRHTVSRSVLISKEERHRLCLTDLARHLHTLAHDREISRVGEVAGVDGRRVEGRCGGDVDAAGAERVLETRLNANGAVTGEGKQKLDVGSGCVLHKGNRLLVHCRVAGKNAGVCAGHVLGRITGRVLDAGKECVGTVGTHEGRQVDIGSGRVDVGKELGRVYTSVVQLSGSVGISAPVDGGNLGKSLAWVS